MNFFQKDIVQYRCFAAIIERSYNLAEMDSLVKCSHTDVIDLVCKNRVLCSRTEIIDLVCKNMVSWTIGRE